ncbi:hypothetical protein BU16DRAFT_467962 [Lophium mytilinum]|uniref:Uncharacterized protein n=1 Tax=Lophium mytilinum TaxID=390894 RepID=A0A6A6QHK4_9PEZI|nr:hypothetical protein BU16DRAFT_467962 [Lophium mytilinum]
MSNFAPPISRDGFVYHGALYADVGNLNRHPRASITELTNMLRPKLSSSGKSKTTETPKDQVGHWYFAQLKHYGLPMCKDKNAAKVRLLNALNSGGLEVPGEVKRLEGALKREYDAANRKAKAEMAKAEGTTAPRKRKAEDGGEEVAKKVKGAEGGLGAPVSDGLAKKDSNPKLNANATKNGATSKQTARKSGPKVKDEANAKKEPVVKKQPAVKKEAGVQKEPAIKKEPSIKKETAVKKEPIVKTEASVKKEPSPKKEPRLKKEPAIKREQQNGNDSPTYRLNAFYNLTCPAISDDWPYQSEGMNLRLRADQDSGCLWGNIQKFGPWSGVIWVDIPPGPIFETELQFRWRMREDGTGELLFRRDQLGTLMFSDDGNMQGRIYGLHGEVTVFWGSRRIGPAGGGSAQQFKAEWDGFVQEAYGRERGW